MFKNKLGMRRCPEQKLGNDTSKTFPFLFLLQRFPLMPPQLTRIIEPRVACNWVRKETTHLLNLSHTFMRAKFIPGVMTAFHET